MNQEEIVKKIKLLIAEDKSHKEIRKKIVSEGANEKLVDYILADYGDKKFRSQFSKKNRVIMILLYAIFAIAVMALLFELPLMMAFGEFSGILVLGLIAFGVGLLVKNIGNYVMYFHVDGYFYILGLLLLLIFLAFEKMRDFLYAALDDPEIFFDFFEFITVPIIIFLALLILCCNALFVFYKSKRKSSL